MKYASSRDSSDRAGGSLSRVTLVSADDTHFMQEVEHQGFAGEQQQGIEHVHPYGFTAVPNSQVNGSTAAAEGVMASMSGNRSHGLVLVIGDRRFRLMNLPAGDVALHRDDGQQIHLTPTGTVISSPNGKSITGQIMSGSAMPVASPQPEGATAQMGQGAQAGQANVTSFELNASSFVAQFGNGSNAVIVKVDKDHSVIKHKQSGNCLWVDKNGCFSSAAISVMADPYSD